MKQYDRYIPIDLPWMKSIPDGWKITKNKCIFEESKELVGEKSKEYSLLSLPAPATKSMAHPDVVKIELSQVTQVDKRNKRMTSV